MMRFCIPRDCYLGDDALEILKDIEGEKCLIVIGGGSVKRNGTLGKIEDYLKEAGIETKLFEGVESNPSVETVEKGARIMQDWERNWSIGLGGGSPIDAAKAMWIFYEYPDLTFEEACVPFGLPKLRNKAHFIGIRTTSGTGT